MPKKKRHHYIPRFYLKRFSVMNEGKFLSLYNLNNKKFIPLAPLKSQAYENFLYGEDDTIENALAEIEGTIAKLFYYWTEERLLYPPPAGSPAFRLLKQFLLLQAFRTPQAGSQLMEQLNEGLKTYVEAFKPEIRESLKDGQLVHENPVLLRLQHAVEHERLLDFLDCKFLVNLTHLPFVTSDSPIILYNQLMEEAGSYMGATGLVAKGLQIFYPLHPRLMLCLYDSEVYEFGNGCVNCASTESMDEVHQLNGLQLINCYSQLFFDDTISEEYIQELNNRYSSYRGTERNINKVIDKGGKKYFLTSTIDPQCNLTLDVFKLKVNPLLFKNEMVPLRHPSFERLNYD